MIHKLSLSCCIILLSTSFYGQSLSPQALIDTAKQRMSVSINEAIDFGGQALALSKKNKDPRGEADALGVISEAYVRNRNFEKGIAYADQAIAKALPLDHQEALFQAYFFKSNALFELTNLEAGLKWLDLAYEAALKKETSPGEMILLLASKGYWQGQRGNFDIAYEALHEALVLTQRDSTRYMQGYILTLLSTTSMFKGDYNRALPYESRSLAVSDSLGDSSRVAVSRHNLCEIYFHLGDYAQALEEARGIERSLELVGDERIKASFQDRMALIFFQMKDYSLSRSYFEQALNLYKKVNDQGGVAVVACNMTPLLIHQQESQLAVGRLTTLIANMKEVKDTVQIQRCQLALATVWDAQGKHKSAQKGYLACIPFYKRHQIWSQLAETYFRLAQSYQKTEDWDRSLSYSEQALHYFEKAHMNTRKAETIELQYQLFKSLGNPEQALAKHEVYLTYMDSMRTEFAQRRLIEERVNKNLDDLEKEKEVIALRNNILTNEKLLFQIFVLFLVLSLAGFIGFYWRLRNTRNRIKQQKEQLEILSKTKDHFFGHISHEFRTPLTLILGQNQYLQAAVDDPALDAKFNMVDRNGRRLLNMVNQILDLAKLESGTLEFRPQTLDIIAFLKNQLFSFDSLANQKQQMLTYEGYEQPLLLVADPEKLERVFFNLLSNAIKFTPEGGQITVQVEKQGQRIRIGLRDNGIGIREKHLPQIFDRFYQTPDNNAHSQGTGIGLSLAKEIVEQHQGTLKVESEFGKGSTFWVELPMPSNTGTPEDYSPLLIPLPEGEIRSEDHSQTISTGPHILIVEDNIDVRAYLRQELESHGYWVTEAEDGLAGLTAAKTQQPDLIISDVMMPHMDGYQLTQAIRANASCSHIPVILLTAKASDESRIKGLETGVDAYLIKPFHAKELRIQTSNLIAQRKHLRQRFAKALTIKAEEVSAVPMDQQFLAQVTETIEAHLSDEQFSVESLAGIVGMSVTHLNRKLNALISQPGGKLIRSMRLQRASDLIQQQAGNVSDIAYELGFSDPANFARAFKAQFGMSPSQFREKMQEDRRT